MTVVAVVVKPCMGVKGTVGKATGMGRHMQQL